MNRLLRFPVLFFPFWWICSAGAQSVTPGQLAHTYSIIAVDSVSGDIGAAVQSHWFAVGNLVIWAQAGVGAVATQSFVNPSYGPKGLDLMSQGIAPADALELLLKEDAGKDFRQVAFIDVQGNSAVFTGDKCIAGSIDRDAVPGAAPKRNTALPGFARSLA